MTKYDYYMTLSFSSEYRELKDETKFVILNEFLQKLRHIVPRVKIISIPYLVSGRLHFHLLTSGITPQDIYSVSSKDVGGKSYYYVDEWTYGYGTMSALYKAVIA